MAISRKVVVGSTIAGLIGLGLCVPQLGKVANGWGLVILILAVVIGLATECFIRIEKKTPKRDSD